MKNDILEFRIKREIACLEDLCEMYMKIMLEKRDKYAEELYVKYSEQKKLLEKILKGE